MLTADCSGNEVYPIKFGSTGVGLLQRRCSAIAQAATRAEELLGSVDRLLRGLAGPRGWAWAKYVFLLLHRATKHMEMC